MTLQASGSVFGLAYGDALGAPTEFMTMERITAVYGPDGPDGPETTPWRVTDDTQMGLAVAEGLLEAAGDWDPAALAAIWSRRFVAWAASPDNDRAPGMTCLRACGGLAEGLPWAEATQPTSKGCGANMRVTPLGLVPAPDDAARAGAAQLQAALTHGHPTGLAASELTAFAVAWLRDGIEPAELPAALRARAAAQRTVYHGDWLGDLWRRPAATSPQDFAARGWDECLAVLDRLDAALAAPDRAADPCAATGEGWVAEEAFATGLLCFLLFPDDPVGAIRRGAASAGDSDSIACLAGAFAGARHGLGGWPDAWRGRIEYADRLARVGAAWD
ncbi:ADP-ribosylglycohydrolase family protein [Actinomadura atramentaria]|uniref:ADP-ribosylglycohydrolase family protein n=1 Tax=Actinomadura atramentaria TaxID=1990 RepID=UPI000380D9C7|nr:ADP-ribosylglycohydrolase family protein [Actinomadura atramentaria]